MPSERARRSGPARKGHHQRLREPNVTGYLDIPRPISRASFSAFTTVRITLSGSGATAQLTLLMPRLSALPVMPLRNSLDDGTTWCRRSARCHVRRRSAA